MCNKCKNECSCKNNSTFHHTMTMQVQDQFGAFIGEPFDIVLTVNVNGNQVTIQVPTINVVINSGFSGGVIATVNNFLPKCLWPETLIFLTFEQKYDSSAFPDTTELSLLVGNDGSLRIVSSVNYLSLIQDGPLITLPTSVTYLVLREKCIMEPPTNVQVSTVRSDAYKEMSSSFFLEFYDVSIENDNVAVCWASNSLDFATAMDQSVSVGKVVYDGAGRPQLQMGPPVIAIKANDRDLLIEQSIAINPTNPLNVVSCSLRRVRTTVVEKDFFQGWTSQSIDGGLTWTSQRTEDTVFTQQRGRGDWNLACDKFGNFWFFGMYQFSDGAGGWTDANRFIGVAVSSDGGQTFQEVGTMTPNDQNLTADYPRISFGGDGQGGYGAWMSVSFYNTNTFAFSVVDVAFFPIGGLGVGNIGPAIEFEQTNTIWDLSNSSLTRITPQFPEILATPDGKVYILGVGADVDPLARLYISANLNGTNNFGPDSFGPAKLVAQGNIIFFGVTEANVVYNGTRTIFESSYRLGYDPELQRIYSVFINEKPTQSQNVSLDLIYSDDDGSSWKVMGPISDTDQSERGTVNMARDAATGNLFFSWFDARGDPSLRSINLFAAVLDPNNIKKKKTKRCCNDFKPIKVPLLGNSDVVTSASVSRTQGKKSRMDIE